METLACPNVNVAADRRAGGALNGAFRRGLLRVWELVAQPERIATMTATMNEVLIVCFFILT
jgi:hypothetical protein